ncbi:MAG: tetratricopeptide repeat protein [Saprospiraceae bacterium]|nr:tetratricopeptide repeat protein [Saprospiraceae bacterium]
MKEKSNIELHEAYLNGSLRTEELNNFKSRLKSDPGFKKEFVQFLLSQSSWSNTKLDQDRDLIKQVYAELQPISYQKPDTKYLLKRFWSDHQKSIAIAASFLLLLSICTVYLWNPPISNEQMFAQFMVEPVSMERASVVEKQFFEKSSQFYYQDQPLIDSLVAQLNKSSEFGIPVYYLAHAYFKTKQYEKALDYFERCLGKLDYINQVPQLQGSDIDIRFNTLLTKFILKKDKAVLLQEINSIEKSIEPTHPLMPKLEKIKKEIQ